MTDSALPRKGSVIRSTGAPWAMVAGWVQDHDETDTYDVSVFAAISRHVNHGTGEGAYPGRKRLASLAGCSTRKVTDTIKHLQQIGAITYEVRQREGGGWLPNLYWLHMDGPRAPGALPLEHLVLEGMAHDALPLEHLVLEGMAPGATESEPEKQTQSTEIAATAADPRPFAELPLSQQLFSAVAWACGSQVDEFGRVTPKPTKVEAGRIGKAVAQLMQVDATPDQVKIARVVWRIRYEDNIPSPQSMVSRWSSLQNLTAAEQTAAPRAEVETLRRLSLIGGE